jgi:hypothetical protein
MPLILFSLGVLLLSAMNGQPQKIIAEEGSTAGPALSRTVVLSPQDFDERQILKICRTYMSQNQAKIAKLVLATTKEDAFYLSKATHTVYESWYPDYIYKAKHAGPFAELIVFGSGATLRIRHSSGKVTQSVLSERDALAITVDGVTFELLDFHFQPLAQPEGGSFEFYFRTPHDLSIRLSEELTKAVLRGSGISHAQVNVRNDSWFIDDPDFPTYYRFTEDPLPAREEYKARSQVGCSVTGDSRVLCQGHNLDRHR